MTPARLHAPSPTQTRGPTMTGNTPGDTGTPESTPDQPNPRVHTRSPFPDATDDFGLAPAPRAKIQLIDPLLGLDLGGFKILRLIGEGGMGRVYEARQEKPDRTVAVKVIRQGITSEKTLRRFEREAEFLARLQHAGIAQIYVVGTYSSDSGDVPFYVMEHIPNAKPITNYVHEHTLPLADRLRLFKQVCGAVSHGHDRGIVHRDLKPGNILIDSSGSPKVIDFGVARSTDSDLQITQLKTDTGQMIGTLQYMSPEQFGENPNDLDQRVDVYSLGVVLYEMLAGCPPYQIRKKGIHEVARIICEQPPEPLWSAGRKSPGAKPGSGNPAENTTGNTSSSQPQPNPNLEIPRSVDAITLRCLQKDRRARYSTAGDLAADIQRFLDGEEVHALKLATGGAGWFSRWGKIFGLAAPEAARNQTSQQPRRTGTRRLVLLGVFVALGLAGLWLLAQAMAMIPPGLQREAENIRQAVLANFDACNKEDVPALMATISRQSPDQAEFKQQAETLFAATDVYMGLADFEILELRPPHAAARIVQITLPADAEDRTKGAPREVFFRDNSGLLPKWECCEYTQTFRKENGKWKLYLITTEPRPVEAKVKQEQGK
jgi:serine/threonine protein kinase